MLQYPIDLDRVFAALTDPGRRLLVERLRERPASATTLGAPLAMSLSAVVQHLQLLEEAGVVASQKTGRVRMYTLERAALDAAAAWIDEQKRAWDRDLDRLDELLSDPSPKRSTP